MKLAVTEKELKQLKEYRNIVKDKTNSPGIRRLAMAEFDRLLKTIKQDQYRRREKRDTDFGSTV